MRALTVVVVVAAFLSSIALAQAQQTYIIQSWSDLAKLPCDAFAKQPDGSWKQVAIVVIKGGAVVSGMQYHNNSESRAIEKRCGASDRKGL